MPELTARQARFVEEYLIDLNATQAAIRSGYSEKTAYSQGERLLRNVEIAAAVAAAQKKRSERTAITADMVLRRWWEIATADPNEVVQYRRTCCRYCHGVAHGYQWREREYLEATKFTEGKTDGTRPDMAGGFGFDPTLSPHPDCPECRGEGVGDVHAHDTRNLSGAGRAIYAGVKQTAQGLEIKIRDQDKALDNVAKHLGMFKDEVKLTGDVVVKVVSFLEGDGD